MLVEKPAARSVAEIDAADRGREAPRRLRARRLQSSLSSRAAARRARSSMPARVGELMFVRGRYGHGGRLGYEKEWRADPALSGGGELIDQGVHLIDLSRWFLGDFTNVEGFADDLLLADAGRRQRLPAPADGRGQAAFLHVSCTEWKNLFSFEIYGRTGKLHIDGLGGSYGVERLTFYRMLPEMGPPETTIWEYPRGDESWELEFREFLDDIALKRTPSAGLAEARAALDVVQQDLRGVDAMIITRSPLRITLGGGGTDLPSYYREHGGFLIAAAIDKYVYVTVMRPFVAGHLSQVLAARACRRRRRCAASDHPRSDPDARLPDAAGRDHHAGRHPGRHRPRLVRQLHDRAAQGALRAPAQDDPARTSWPSSPARSRSTGSASRRQAGSIHRRVRRHHLLPFQSGRDRSSASAVADQLRHDGRPRGQPAAVLHRLLAQRGSILKDQKARSQTRRRRDDRATSTTSRSWPYEARQRSSNGQRRRLRRADARALGAQEAALGRDVAIRRSTSGTSSGCRTARSAASWSAPAAAAS